MKTGRIPIRPRAGTCALFGAAALLAMGCTRLEKTRSAARLELDEHSRAITTGVVDTLQLQPEARRDEYTALALELARSDQRIEGLPHTGIPVGDLLGRGTDSATAEEGSAARRALENRLARIERLLAQEKHSENQLIALGQQLEAEQNRKLAEGWRQGGLITGIAVLAMLCLLFPAVAPAAGRLLAALVDRAPGLAGPAGVVSVKAFDALLKGIARSGTNARFGNNSAADSSRMDELHAHLSRELDAPHKRLVRARKQSLNLAEEL